MSVKTSWPITYACGHAEDRNLSANPADKRAGYARWLATKPCTACWRASKRAATTQWTVRRRADEQADIATWEMRAEMGPLTGSKKAADWGRRCRYQLLAAAYDAMVVTSDLPEAQYIEFVERPARHIDAAAWWIDNRDTDPVDVRELLDAAAETAAAASENNP